jgi:phosphatidate phosphatase PAH1
MTSLKARSSFPVFDLKIGVLICTRSIKTIKGQVTQALVKALQLDMKETVIDIDGTVTTQPVLQHMGIFSWPGEL